MSKSFLDLPLEEIVPSSLLTDPNIVDICTALQSELDLLKETSLEIELLSRIDKLPEPVLRMLAWENRISSIEWTLAQNIEEKRQLVHDSFDINRRRGTRGSIERIFELLGMSIELEEWFEYGGPPGTFRITVLELGDRGIQPEEYGMIDMLVLRYKALTRWLESITFWITSRAKIFAGAIGLMRHTDTVHPYSNPLAIGTATVTEIESIVEIINLTPPNNVSFQAGGSSISGDGTPNYEVFVKFDNVIIGQGYVKQDGSFNIIISPPFTNGETVYVFFKHLNFESDHVEIIAPNINPNNAITNQLTFRAGDFGNGAIGVGTISIPPEWDIPIGELLDTSLWQTGDVEGVSSDDEGVVVIIVNSPQQNCINVDIFVNGDQVDGEMFIHQGGGVMYAGFGGVLASNKFVDGQIYNLKVVYYFE